MCLPPPLREPGKEEGVSVCAKAFWSRRSKRKEEKEREVEVGTTSTMVTKLEKEPSGCLPPFFWAVRMGGKGTLAGLVEWKTSQFNFGPSES